MGEDASSTPAGDCESRHGGACDIPLPLLCLGGVHVPLERTYGGQGGNGKFLAPDRYSCMLRRQDKKMMCVDREDAQVLGMHGDDVHVQRKQGTFTVSCHVLDDKPPTMHAAPTCLSVPMYFGLELIQSFPKSYVWLSQQARRRKKGSFEISGVDEIGHIPVYSVPNLNITQICDTDQRLPVEYKAYFLSKKQLLHAWSAGRRYLTAASLAGRQQRRQHAFDALHAKAAVIASRGGWFIPPQSSSVDVNEDEDGLVEPVEVQELAAELGMGGMPQLHDDSSNASPIDNAKSFMATLACGVIATLSPIVQGCSMTLDSAFASVPVLDRLILGDTVPPRRAIMQEENMIHVLQSTHTRNIAKLHTMESEKAPHQDNVHSTLRKRLALSALWMGISMKLLLQQQLMGSLGTSILIAPSSASKESSIAKGDAGHMQHGMNAAAQHKAQDPVVMDIMSSLMGSLQANELIKMAVEEDDNQSAHETKSLQLENILSMHNGLSIEYKSPSQLNVDKDSSSIIPAEGVMLIGDVTPETEPSTSSRRRHALAAFMLDQRVQVPVSVHNGIRLIAAQNSDAKTTTYY